MPECGHTGVGVDLSERHFCVFLGVSERAGRENTDGMSMESSTGFEVGMDAYSSLV
jgi:hypothetical protein